MRKTHKSGLFSLLIGFSLILFIVSCVDLSVENIPQSINYRSKVKFMNDVPGADATITVDGSQVGTVQSGGESSYMDATSGSRYVKASYTSGPNVEGNVILDTDRKIIVTIVEDSTGARFFVKSDDGYIWE